MRLFEIHDQPWFPGLLRDQTTDALQFVLNAGNLYGPIVPQLSKALKESGAVRILDLCSGAGGPWLSLPKALEQKVGHSLEICLTDKYPHAHAFDNAKALEEKRVRFHSSPVDAMQIPDGLTGFRTMFSSFHHFEPSEARAILQDAVNKGQGIGIFEAAGRRAKTIFLTFLMPVGCLALTPFIRPFRWSRFLWTYIIPVVPFVLWFDGVMSCLRSYSPQELGDLTSGLTGLEYDWKIGQDTSGLFALPITYLIGCPIRETRRGATSPKS